MKFGSTQSKNRLSSQKDFELSWTKEWNLTRKNLAGVGGGNRTFGHPRLVAARTKDAMLKIESTNIHMEMVSRNSTKIDGIPPLKGPWRRKLQTTGMHAHSKTFGEMLSRKKKKKAFRFAISPTFNMLVYKVGGGMGQTEEDYWRMSRILSDLRDIYSWFILLRGHLVPRLDRPGLLPGFIKQRGPHKPILILRQKFQVLLPSFNWQWMEVKWMNPDV